MNKTLKKSIVGIIILSMCFASFCIGRKTKEKKDDSRTSGVIHIDKSEEDEPEKIFLELTCSLPTLKSKKYAIFAVSNKNYLTHK